MYDLCAYVVALAHKNNSCSDRFSSPVISKCKRSTNKCGGCLLTRKLRHPYQLVLPFKNKLLDQCSELKPAIAGHVIGLVSTSPPITAVTTFGFATIPFTEILTFEITSASSHASPVR